MRSTWPLVQGCLILVSRCSMPFSWQRISNICVTYRAVGPSARESKLDPIVGENRVDLVGNSRDQSFEEGRGGGPSRLPDQLHEGELAGAIDGDVKIELAFSGLDLRDVDVEIADRIGLELFLRRLAAFDLWQRLMPWR